MTGFLAQFGYLAIFGVLLLCGVGFPVPEEFVLIPTGYLCYKQPEAIQLMPAIGVCMAGILLGDSIMFCIGQRYGPRLLALPRIRKLMTPRIEEKVRHTFAKYGDWAVFIARFLAGARIWVYFTAGTMRMPFRRFFMLDLIGTAISVPPSIWFGKYFGENIERAYDRFQDVILGVVIAAAVAFAVWWILQRRAAAAARPPETPLRSGTGSPPKAQ